MYISFHAFIYEVLMMSVEMTRIIAAITVFLLWIKVFYWMRLFESTAYFINLISQTIADIKIFLYLVLIVVIAFANVFFILNNNTASNETYRQNHLVDDGSGNMVMQDKFSYIQGYTGISYIDPFISTFLIWMGEFNLEGQDYT